MEDSLGILIKRIRDKDPLLTPQELEKGIAHCVGMKINELIKQTVTEGHIELLQQTVHEALGLSCEVTPALSLYVRVSNAEDQETSIESFSSLPFEEALAVIAEKDFSAFSSEKILELITETINQTSELFVHNVLLSHPLIIKIFRQFAETFHEQLAIMMHDSITILSENGYTQKKDGAEYDNRPGMYL